MDIVSRLSTHTHRFDALTSIQVLLDSALDLALIHRLNILALRLLVSSHTSRAHVASLTFNGLPFSHA